MFSRAVVVEAERGGVYVSWSRDESLYIPWARVRKSGGREGKIRVPRYCYFCLVSGGWREGKMICEWAYFDEFAKVLCISLLGF